jgi:hypothetical protein
MDERPRLLVLDLLESYARERSIDVVIERLGDQEEWVCVLRPGERGLAVRCTGRTAREAIVNALGHEGVDVAS